MVEDERGRALIACYDAIKHENECRERVNQLIKALQDVLDPQISHSTSYQHIGEIKVAADMLEAQRNLAKCRKRCSDMGLNTTVFGDKR